MNILIADDHLMTIEGYIAWLHRELGNFNPYKAITCEEAYNIITSNRSLDLAIVDYQIPEFPAQQLRTGVDIVLLIKKLHPNCKTIVITAYEEATILYDIHKKARPDALLNKNDITYSTLKDCFRAENRFFSSKVSKAIETINTNEELLNDKNREILIYLKQGFKINEIANILSFSESTIQKRIAKMREIMDSKDINGLIKEATLQKII